MLSTTVAAIVTVLSLSACRPDPTQSTGDTGTGPLASWALAWDTTGAGALSGVWGSGPDDIWMVGGQPGSAEIYHYDGAAWSPVPSPDVALLVWVYGFGPDDVWSVGEEGAVVHWDGDSWTAFDSGTTEDLWGVWGAAPDDLWIVGGDPNDGDPAVLHYDGSAFNPVALDPVNNDRAAHALFKVWGIGGHTWAVGQYGLIVSWDGAQWVQQGTGASDDFVSLWGPDADHVVAVGGRSSAQIATLSGDAWTTVYPRMVPGLNAVTFDGGTGVIGGLTGWVGSVDPADPENPVSELDPDPQRVDVHALWSDGAGAVWGVAGHFYDPYYGTALVRTEASR